MMDVLGELKFSHRNREMKKKSLSRQFGVLLFRKFIALQQSLETVLFSVRSIRFAAASILVN